MNFHRSIRPLNAALLGTAAVGLLQLVSAPQPLSFWQRAAVWAFSLSIPLMAAAGLAIERALDESHHLHYGVLLIAPVGWLGGMAGFCSLIEHLQTGLGFAVFILGASLALWIFQHGVVIPAQTASSEPAQSPHKSVPPLG